MKRKIATLLTLLLALTMLAGCGDSSVSTSGSSSGSSSGKSKDTIPLSEVIFSDEDVIIYYVSSSGGMDYTDIGKGTSPGVEGILTSDGNIKYEFSNEMKLGEIAQTSDEELIISLGDGKNGGAVSWNIVTDGSGNNTDYIYGYADYINCGDYDRRMFLGFKGFLGHITIYDTSFMVFRRYDINNSGKVYEAGYYLVRDTKDTIDKTVYFDEPGTDGFTTDAEIELKTIWYEDIEE